MFYLQGPALAWLERFCLFFLVFSSHIFFLAWQQGSCSTAHLPVELVKKLLQNLGTELMPDLVNGELDFDFCETFYCESTNTIPPKLRESNFLRLVSMSVHNGRFSSSWAAVVRDVPYRAIPLLNLPIYVSVAVGQRNARR